MIKTLVFVSYVPAQILLARTTTTFNVFTQTTTFKTYHSKKNIQNISLKINTQNISLKDDNNDYKENNANR